jgi:hypothetical protein
VAAKGALTGSGTDWSLAIAVSTAGAATVSITRTGIDRREKDITLYKNDADFNWSRIDSGAFADWTGIDAISYGGGTWIAGRYEYETAGI